MTNFTRNFVDASKRYYFAPTALIIIDKTKYRTYQVTDIGHVFVPCENTAMREFFTHDQIYDLVHSGKLDFDQDHFAEGRAKSRARFDEARVVDLSDDEQARVTYYAAACDIVLRMKEEARADRKLPRVSLSDESLDRIMPLIQAELDGKQRAGKRTTITLPGKRHFRRIYKRYIEGGYEVMSLVKRCSGSKGRPSVHDAGDMLVWMEKAAEFADPRKPTMAALYRELEAKLYELNAARAANALLPHKMPTRKVFEKLIKDMDGFHVCQAREGMDVALRKYQISSKGVDVQRPGERVEMDEWTIDLLKWVGWLGMFAHLTAEQRAKLKSTRIRVIVAIDVATRCILALRFVQGAADGQHAIDAIEMMVTDKAYLAKLCGATSLWPYHLTPELLVTDNGGAFNNYRVRSVTRAMGMMHMFPQAGRPQMRGAIESVLKTFSKQFMHWFEGRTFGDIFEKGDLDPTKRVTLAMDEVNTLLGQAIIDIYHHVPHEGLSGETPHNAWMRLAMVYGVMPPPPSRIRRHIFGSKVTRIVTDHGVESFGIYYQSRELQALRMKTKATVDIRVNPYDLKTISVWNGTGWLSVDATAAIPNDLSIWEWTGACREVALENAENRKLHLSTMLDAVNRLRLAGDAARARANLATVSMDATKMKELQLRYFDPITLIDDLEDRDPILVPLIVAEDPLMHGIPGINDEILTVDPNTGIAGYVSPAPIAAASAAPVTIKSASDIQL
ncbi:MULTISPECIES: Mu transposase C-terminal domain-containing protein [unclassified Rhizobium]|uniref:Mu transposase C-terminal domain-containing protein n=1 Tax=unclassified Rhizobium TaxID=2613769 RepID=UPI001ADC2E15|nr:MULTISPECIES: Mu transposase C-terminal domain-containing protein [unclassified Rhizobium]MBO9126916.1 DDE-type integrase/transposase/recombinase [Rhizobium sp. 16-488-2b]MBO9177364.1 DDE-type integrase/transposase/recombinase [Rhizobium sp. 16-488-2a]